MPPEQKNPESLPAVADLQQKLSDLKKEVGLSVKPEDIQKAAELQQKQNKIESATTKKLDQIAQEVDPRKIDSAREELAPVESSRERNNIISSTRSKINDQIRLFLNVVKNFFKMQFKPHQHSIEELEKLKIDTKTFSPMVDLSAFDLSKLRAGKINMDKLKEKGVREIVIMEDRDPQFFLNYQGYEPDAIVPLNRHGKKEDQWRMSDLKKLMEEAKKSGVKVTIGFWGNAENAQNNAFIKKNWNTLKPMIPGSSDINPLAIVKDSQGKSLKFADYVVQQYQKLHQDFGFEGLFLGDGLMGYRDFKDPNAPYDFSETSKVWTDFYKTIHQGVHRVTPEGKLWAFDVMGKGPEDALKHGVDQKAIAPYLDSYIFQAYGSDAWGKDYMGLPGYDLDRDQKAISSLPPDLAAKTKYTLSFGDQVEGWVATKSQIEDKHNALNTHAKQGTFGVWSNQVLQPLLG